MSIHPTDISKSKVPGKPVSLSAQIASGLAAMAMTLIAMAVSVPPRDIATAGRILIASSGVADRFIARA